MGAVGGLIARLDWWLTLPRRRPYAGPLEGAPPLHGLLAFLLADITDSHACRFFRPRFIRRGPELAGDDAARRLAERAGLDWRALPDDAWANNAPAWCRNHWRCKATTAP